MAEQIKNDHACRWMQRPGVHHRTTNQYIDISLFFFLAALSKHACTYRALPSTKAETVLMTCELLYRDNSNVNPYATMKLNYPEAKVNTPKDGLQHMITFAYQLP